MSMGLTPSLSLILEAMKEGFAATGKIPSYRKIAATLNMRSPQAIHYSVNRLEERGHVERVYRGRRVYLRLTPKAFEQPGVQS